jgi:hypothetical protein
MPGPAAPIATEPTIDALTPDKAPPRSVDVEMLLAASTIDKDMAASAAPPTTPDASSVAVANAWELTAARAGMGLIALGFVFLVGSLLVSLFVDPRERDSSGLDVDRDGATPVVVRGTASAVVMELK